MVDATGHSRIAVLSVIVFFVVGAAMLMFVDVEAGRIAWPGRQKRKPSEANRTPLKGSIVTIVAS